MSSLPDSPAPADAVLRPRRFRFRGTCLLPVLAFVPALVTLLLIRLHAVNVPFWDDWERVPYIRMWEEGTLTLKALYAPHIDHRMFFPRLIMLVCNSLSGGDLRVEMAVNFLIVLLTAIGVVKLLQITVTPGSNLPWGLIFTGNLILFSPMQYENWLWAVQTAFFLPMACLIWSLVIVLRPWRWWVRLLAALALALVGTHSFGHGFVVWPAVLGVVLLTREFQGAARNRWWFAGLWTAAGVVVILCYTQLDFNNVSHPSHSYGQHPGQPPPSAVHSHAVLGQPAHFAQYVSVLAGSMFARFQLTDPVKIATGIGGALILLLFLFSLFWLWSRRKGMPGDLSDRCLPWLALAWASLTGLCAIACGRMALETGFARASAPRYNSIALHLSLGLLFGAGLLFSQWRQRHAFSPGVHATAGWLLGLGTALLVPGWIYGSQMMEFCRQSRLQAQAALMFLPHFGTQHAPRIDADPNFVLAQSRILERYHYLKRPPLKSLDLAQFRPSSKKPIANAMVSGFSRQPDGSWQVAGTASFNRRPADLILVSAESPGQPAVIVGIAETGKAMPAPVYHLDLFHIGRWSRERTIHLEWNGTLAPEAFSATPGGTAPLTIKFWLLDIEVKRAFRIRGSWQLDPATQILSAGEDA